MWNNLETLWPRLYLGDAPAVGNRPDASELARTVQQARAASTKVSEVYDRAAAGGEAPAGPPDQAIQDLVNLSTSAGLLEGEVATVHDILTRLQGGQPLRAEDVQALAGVVHSLQERIAAPPGPRPVDQEAVNQRADKIVALASGYTSDGDEQEILKLLGEAKDPAEMQALLATLKGKGLDFQALLGEMDSDENRAKFLGLTAGAMSTDQQAEALQALSAGYTSGAQEQAMMAIVRASGGKPEDIKALLDAVQGRGMTYHDLFSELGDNQEELLKLTIPGMNAEQKAAAIQQFASGYTPTSEEQAIATLLESETGHDGRAGLLKALQGQGVDYPRLVGELEETGPRYKFQTTYMRLPDYEKLQEQGVPLTDAGIKQAMNTAVGAVTDPARRASIQAELQKLEAAGKLDARLMTQVLALTDPTWAPLAPGLNREELIEETLKDLNDPTRINQAQWGTCAGTRVQTALALRDPGRYVEIMRRLASPEGDATDMVPDLKRPPDIKLDHPDTLPPDDDGHPVVGAGTRSLTARIMSPALMNAASGGHYVNATDKHDFPWYDPAHWDHGGLYTGEQNTILEGVLGVEYRSTSDFQEIDAAAARGQLVPVSLNWGDGSHALLYAGSQVDASGQPVALLINPWGQRHTMPLAEFSARLKNAQLPQDEAGAATAIPRPAGGADLATYTPLADSQYMTWKQTLEHSPGYANLDSGLQSGLRDLVGDNKLSANFVIADLRPLIANGELSEALLKRLHGIAERHKGQPDQEAWVSTQIANMRDMAARPDFDVLEPDVQQRVLDLLANKDMGLGRSVNPKLAALAHDGKLTPELLTQLEALPDAAAVRAAILAA